MNDTFYRQCLLRKTMESGKVIRETTSWIPEEFAVPDTYIKLRDDKGNWEDGWKVVNANFLITAKQANEQSQNYKKQREASDI